MILIPHKFNFCASPQRLAELVQIECNTQVILQYFSLHEDTLCNFAVMLSEQLFSKECNLFLQTVIPEHFSKLIQILSLRLLPTHLLSFLLIIGIGCWRSLLCSHLVATTCLGACLKEMQDVELGNLKGREYGSHMGHSSCFTSFEMIELLGHLKYLLKKLCMSYFSLLNSEVEEALMLYYVEIN